MNMNMQDQAVECKIRVKSGDLAAQGKGTMAVIPMPDGHFQVGLSLPDAAGVCSPVDLTSIERIELVKTKTGWFDQGEWIKPLVVTVGVAIVVTGTIIVVPAIDVGIFMWAWWGIMELGPQILTGTAMTSAIYAAGVYTGTKLKRVARFVVTTQDGRHAVLEGPEPIFHFMSGVYAAPNLQLEVLDSEASSAPSSEPVPTPA